MIKILFVCHGNICRSPMAEFVFRDLVQKRGMGDLFSVSSAATSREEIGNSVHLGTVRKLRELGISTEGKYAVQLRKQDYDVYDYIIGMDSANIRNMNPIIGQDPECKVHKLLDFGSDSRDIADPWYTGDFERTYRDVLEGCEGLLLHIQESQQRL